MPEPEELKGDGLRAGRRLLLGLGVMVVALGSGVGGYLIGSTTGPDIALVQAEGRQAGTELGTQEGEKDGLRRGRTKGRQKGYKAAFPSVYRRSYRAAFRDAGIEPPSLKEVKVPRK